MRYMMRMIKYFTDVPKPVGRWNNDCIMKTNKKIDFSNEDHVVKIY